MSSAPTLLALPPGPRILVVCTRRLGDVLLCTPLLRSLRRAWPQAQIDLLVNPGTGAIVEGNPDIDRVMAVGEPAGSALRIARRYDLAVATLASDRAHALAFLAAPRRAGILPPGKPGWKRLSAQHAVSSSGHDRHAVVQYLRLAEALGVACVPEVVPPRTPGLPAQAMTGRYAVIHPSAMFRYKSWTVAGWRELIAGTVGRGLEVALTGGPAPAEREYVRALATGSSGAPLPGVHDFSGQLRFGQLTGLIERAAFFVGPDTSVTHLAAATGTPTVALFGPSNPIVWGPWPNGAVGPGEASPWVLRAPLQQRGNVHVIQGITPCMPCLQEGCERKLDSRADCLDWLPPARVLAVIDQVLSA